MVRITSRDVRLVSKCGAAQWLTTSQVQRLFFRDVTADRVRKRLRKLGEDGYLRALQPNQMAEMFHTVGPEGKRLLEGKGLDVKLLRKLPEHLEHLVGINDIRVEVESAEVEVSYFFAHWELGKFGWGYPVIPDAVFSVRLGREATFMVEYDRSTEDRSELSGKLRQYQSVAGSFPFDAVVIVTESCDAADRLSHLFRFGRQAFPVLGTSLHELRAEGMFGPVFRNGSQKVSLGDVLEDADRDA